MFTTHVVCKCEPLQEPNILYKFQFGFRTSHSTSHAIISMVEKVNNAVGVFLDLKKRLIHMMRALTVLTGGVLLSL